MKKTLLHAIRKTAGRLLSRPGTPAPAEPPQLDAEQGTDALAGRPNAARGGGRATLAALFAAGPHRSTLSAATQADRILHQARAVDAQQPGYQPVYGFTEAFPGKRRAHLERNVRLVHEALAGVKPAHQVRILDVGCNSGYVSLRLAESFPNVVGLEIARPNLTLCRMLAAHAGSNARFFGDDVLDIVATSPEELVHVDVVLLYNVVHQFIFHRGLQQTQTLLAALAAGVDTVIVELARQADYVRHGKDQLLPERPEDVLAACEDVEITQLHERPRPVYRLRRRTVRVGATTLRPERIAYSPNPDPAVSRKYYTGEGRFLKLYRFAEVGASRPDLCEARALQALQHTTIVPRLLAHEAGAQHGAVLMSQVVGERLVPRLYHPARYKLWAKGRMRLTRQYLEIARLVHEAIGYQNDLQAHNLLIQPDGSLVLVDFEQAGPEPINDPYGLLLWSLFDIWGGRDKNRPAAIRSLHVSRQDAEGAAHRPIYPDLSALVLPADVRALADAAAGARAARIDWGAFVAEWAPRLAAAPDPTPATAAPASGPAAGRKAAAPAKKASPRPAGPAGTAATAAARAPAGSAPKPRRRAPRVRRGVRPRPGR